MNLASILVWGFAATIVLTTTLAAGHQLRLTRLSMAFLLGTMFTPARDRAMVIGFGVHFVNGVLIALVYGAIFEMLGASTWRVGAGLGALHGFFVLVVVLPLLPGLHPYMVSEYYGPTPNRLLQPPGFLGLNYGHRTPYVTLAAHLLYGAILGGLYELQG